MIRKFRWTDGSDNDMGLDGWNPIWIPASAQFSPGDSKFPVSMLHDMLEHTIKEDGSLASEMRALGAMTWMRGETGFDFCPYQRHFPNILANEIYDVLERAWDTDLDQVLVKPPRTLALRNQNATEEIFQEIRKYLAWNGRVCDHREALENEEGSPRFAIESSELDHALDWIRIGYRAAIKRFGAQKQYSMCSIFQEGVRQLSKVRDGEVGQILTVKIDMRRHEVRAWTAYGWES